MEEVEDDLAEELKSKCPVDVFDIEDLGKGEAILFTMSCCLNGVNSGHYPFTPCKMVFQISYIGF